MHDTCIGKRSTVNDVLINGKNQSNMVEIYIRLFEPETKLVVQLIAQLSF